MAAAHLAAGRLAEAERDARSAVDYFATTDFITFHANSALILGDVLRAAGRRSRGTRRSSRRSTSTAGRAAS